MKRLKMKFVGISPILLSCDQLADPLNPKTIKHKQLTSKKNKTAEDHLEMARSQWEGLMYWNDEVGVYIPTQCLRATIVNGAKLNKLGMQVKRGTLMMEEFVPLDYGAKLTLDELWDKRYVDRRTVVVSQSRVMCYRPKFSQWSVEFNIDYDEKTLDPEQIIKSADNAGQYVGLCGYRPEKGGSFGRFEVKV